jgi:spoIIIJ-associated protein
LVAIEGGELSSLVGEDGAVLEALQDLSRLAVQRETGERSRLMLDVAGHRATKKAALTKVGTEAAKKALSSKKPIKMDPMNAFERKVIHDAVGAAGASSESEGEEPNRYIVVLPHP